MKKLLLFLTLTLLSTVATFAQSTLIGTLSHNGEITVFHGSDALIQAHNAAVAGDVITLSAGTFTGTTITKAVTIRGAGMFLENGTTLSGRTTLSVADDENGFALTLEGLKLMEYVIGKRLIAPIFIKCSFDGIYTANRLYNAKYINCVINGFSDNNSVSSSSPNVVNCINCIINEIDIRSSYSFFTFDNCIFDGKFATFSATDGAQLIYLQHSTWRNCIIKTSTKMTDSHQLGETFGSSYGNIFINCKYQGSGKGPFRLIGGNATKTYKVNDDLLIFKDGTFYELTDELASTWVDDNDSQIGIYGGSMPFDPTPLNPQITKFNVASKTSADGKLSVDIEVKAIE